VQFVLVFKGSGDCFFMSSIRCIPLRRASKTCHEKDCGPGVIVCLACVMKESDILFSYSIVASRTTVSCGCLVNERKE
jgi:hypothetical protein